MSAFKQKLARLGASAGVLAGATAMLLAVGGVTAGSAMASELCPNAATIAGKGSSLQKIAQETWTAGYKAECPGGPTVTYTSTGSGPGLEAFGFTGGALNSGFQFIGTDDAPNSTQIGSAETASGVKPIIVPVTQTAIAVVVHPPTKCELRANLTHGISWSELNAIFGGKTITNWNQLAASKALETGACNHVIKRVVRAEGSGTTYQFKNYLSALEGKGGEALPCTTEGHTTWAQLRAIGTEEKPNKTWPCPPGEGGTEIITAAGGGALVQEVVNTEGAIGYASLPDAKSKTGNQEANLQNFENTGKAEYVSPAVTATSTAACESARYTVPNGGREGVGTGEGVDWSEVFGANPNIGGTEYPLCTLTYDIGWTTYTEADYGSEAAAKGADVKAYVDKYVVPSAKGQTAIAGKWYSTLPTLGGAGSTTDVQNAAEFAAALIN